jgi:DNA excision repair protein ERCC-6
MLTNRVLENPKQRRLFKANDLRDLFVLADETPSAQTESDILFAGHNASVAPAASHAASSEGGDKAKKRAAEADTSSRKKQRRTAADDQLDASEHAVVEQFAEGAFGKVRASLKKNPHISLNHFVTSLLAAKTRPQSRPRKTAQRKMTTFCKRSSKTRLSTARCVMTASSAPIAPRSVVVCFC